MVPLLPSEYPYMKIVGDILLHFISKKRAGCSDFKNFNFLG